LFNAFFNQSRYTIAKCKLSKTRTTSHATKLSKPTERCC